MDALTRLTKTPIAIVGSVNLDLKTSALAPAPELFSDGETSVESIYESIGGGGANAATAAARLGGNVHFCGCVGEDALGQRLEDALRAFGVTPHLRRKPTATGRSINLNWRNHHRHFISSLPNNRAMTAADIDVAELAAAGCRHLYRADVWFSEPMLDGGNTAILRAASEAGMETSIDINWDPEWSVPNNARVAQRKSLLAASLAWVDWAHGNEAELQRFTDTSDTHAACRRIIELGARNVIVHRGEKGAAAFNARDGWLEVLPCRVAKVVCETGTGDVFSAAFLLLRDASLKERLADCAAIAAAHLGGKLQLIPRL